MYYDAEDLNYYSSRKLKLLLKTLYYYTEKLNYYSTTCDLAFKLAVKDLRKGHAWHG